MVKNSPRELRHDVMGSEDGDGPRLLKCLLMIGGRERLHLDNDGRVELHDRQNLAHRRVAAQHDLAAVYFATRQSC